MSDSPDNLRDMLARIQDMQAQIQRTQEALENQTVSEETGGGLVRATVNGKQELVGLSIAPEAMGDREMLEDLVIAAVNKAARSAAAIAARELGKATSESMSGLKIPGLDLS
jgi:DNA-binding YbaB/EbfC family protein